MPIAPLAVGAAQALRVERGCALVAAAFSQGHRGSARIISGEARGFGLNASRSVVHIPYPALAPDWNLRTWTCGVALQCAPSKDRIAHYPLQDLSLRERMAVVLAEGEVAMGWVAAQWPGLMSEMRRHLPDLQAADPELSGPAIFARAQALAHSQQDLVCPPLLGHLPFGTPGQAGLLAAIRRMYGRMPWSKPNQLISPKFDSIPVGGEGNVRNPNLPPPSRPEEEDVEIRADQRAGIPYPEWNFWNESFLRDHVAVLERKHVRVADRSRPVSADLRKWFEEHTRRVMKNGLEDGSDLDIDRYIEHYIDTACGRHSEARVFRDLLPAFRDVTTALLLDGSASLGAGRGGVFQLELACADALCHAMTLARERHGLFLFNGNTRHRVDVTCLKDFADPRLVLPGDLGLSAGGYTRLGAPLRHLTSRLLEQPAERRLLIVIGDGLISDEGYEGRYAWADSAHAVEEAEDAGVSIYYIGVGQVRVDPLPDVFGARRSTRITRVEDLPRVLARVHRELVDA
ncbi:nitric oxide reductase activation protein NorD [Solimonas terrae]|uniref:VWA domain-containing protein n=1 Tax=Solimonas terrae TaxID=1396819 RepID=A0A6M2BVH7_9GAMM|nr:VWA domain-containing protein [Solimonas terrae]